MYYFKKIRAKTIRVDRISLPRDNKNIGVACQTMASSKKEKQQVKLSYYIATYC
jgi:hypothetical protein